MSIATPRWIERDFEPKRFNNRRVFPAPGGERRLRGFRTCARRPVRGSLRGFRTLATQRPGQPLYFGHLEHNGCRRRRRAAATRFSDVSSRDVRVRSGWNASASRWLVRFGDEGGDKGRRLSRRGPRLGPLVTSDHAGANGDGCLGGVLPVRPRPPASALSRPTRDREERTGCFIGSASALSVTSDRAGKDRRPPVRGLRPAGVAGAHPAERRRLFARGFR
jgi:hypothetical protein